MLSFASMSLARADDVPRERWPAIAAACLRAYPDRVSLPVDPAQVPPCTGPPARCDGSDLVSPSVAACIGNTLAYPPEGRARVQVFGPESPEDGGSGLVYRVVRPLEQRCIRESGWYVDAHDGRVVSDWHGPQLNMQLFTGQARGLPYD